MTTAAVMSEPGLPAAGAARARVAEVREFGRFWARDVVSRLDDGLAGSTYSPAEARVIFDLGSGGRTELGWLRVSSGVDAGHLVRIVQRLRNEGLVATSPVPGPGGPALQLTVRGQEVLAVLDRQVADHASSILAGLREDRQRDVVAAMAMIRRALSGQGTHPFALRAPRPGDLGWVVARHGAVYADEYGWDERFEGEVAQVVAGFAGGRDPARERAWIAEVDAAPAGCVFCLRDGDRSRRPGSPSAAIEDLRAGGISGAARADGAGSTWTADGAVGPPSPDPVAGGPLTWGPVGSGPVGSGPVGSGPVVSGTVTPAAGRARDDARLCLLLVDPAARGLGVGRRLVGEGVAFARRAGYQRLWMRTEDLFVSSRRIIEAAGFALAEEFPHRRHGRLLRCQEWVLHLGDGPA